MSERVLKIAAYDIRDPRRLREGLEVLKGYSTGGQKSVFECFLTGAEEKRLLREVRHTIEVEEDDFLLLPMDARLPVVCLGRAVRPEDPPYFWIG